MILLLSLPKTDQSKLSTKFGDEPDLLFNRAQGRISLHTLGASATATATAAAQGATLNPSVNAARQFANIQLEATFNDCESGYVPTVGRWGAEWPSWLAAGQGQGQQEDGGGGAAAALPTADANEKNDGISGAAAAAAGRSSTEQKLADAICGLGLTTTRVSANAEKPITITQRANGATGQLAMRTPSTSSSSEDDDEDVEEPQQWTPTDLTSVVASERYSDIGQLLARQKTSSASSACAELPASSWAMADGYDLSAYNQVNGVWPLGHPLPLPDWGSSVEDETPVKETLIFDNVWQYEELNGIVETALQRMLEETHYNTVNLFVDFYRSFKRTRRSDLRSFFQFYDVPINRRHHMCVSLAFEIIARLVQMFPQLGQYLYVVSCEEQVADCNDYVQMDEEYGMNSADAGVEKEHVMVAMRFAIGERHGVMILDPGYHVGRAVTVMNDQSYPHTGEGNILTHPLGTYLTKLLMLSRLV